MENMNFLWWNYLWKKRIVFMCILFWNIFFFSLFNWSTGSRMKFWWRFLELSKHGSVLLLAAPKAFQLPILTMAMLSFYTPRKHQETFGFLVFSGGIKWKHMLLSVLSIGNGWVNLTHPIWDMICTRHQVDLNYRVIFLWFSFCSNTAHSFVAERFSLTTSLCVVIPQACWLLLLYPTLFGSRYLRMDQVEFVKIVFKKFGEIWSA